MIDYRPGERVLALTLAAVSGYADSLGFMFFGGVFLSFMSGNTTRMAVTGVEEHPDLFWLTARCIALFLVGVMLGAVVHRLATRRWGVYRAREAVLVTVSTAFVLGALAHAVGWSLPAMLFVSLGVGAVNSVFERKGEVSIPLTYVTGTLVKTAQRIVDSFFGGDHRAWIYPFTLWVCLAVGALLGALAFTGLGLGAIYPLAAALVVVTVVNQVVRSRRRAAGLAL
ncbi:YoaK family protein [Corynebacterium bovis]|uniref:YoaK family protein n=1 Tax=Corynebacterium bovis TaxID=36808 RepID=UPI002447177D|nr:YoaK family protein [Corynebacterium bovis]MDH2454911.1 YoaK family protein [Corynebacterium bovis]